MDGKKGKDFRKRLLSTFGVEAREHIRAISSGLIALKRTGPWANNLWTSSRPSFGKLTV